ncbi:phospholipase A2 inhibitor NAI-like [Anomaloglossus baeobatrachus]|uniref:phospholipase A2 inhibitor NAI-like n=1 Tax=Anomaloglossus baeobatrachus TaxID=238106 RepID=UPI003F505D68
MKNLLALLFMISAFVVSVFSYKCYSCFSLNSTTCNESQIECLGDRCMTASQFYDREGDVFKSIFKSCANETLCGTNGSAASENVMFRFHANCCTGNLCNTDRYKILADPTPNGIKCKSAFCTGKIEECTSDKMMNCTGSMNKCFTFRGKTMDPDLVWNNVSAKGCINDDACKFSFDSAIGVSEGQRQEFICYE